MLTTEQKLLCSVAHLGWLVGLPIIAPLIIMLLASNGFVKNQAQEALAFQIGMAILGAIFGVLSILLIGLPFLMIIWFAGLILPVLATIRVCKDMDYSYPITGSFIRKNI
ncbi:DUF4870 domain-containing protein [Crassaminicella profunda]|uniref:DUF4870 domain-containing protein n=1 Tax=Crassaminicella profunda TaxID=1286698 RepID=UPI001CA6A627|nr:DUF4870 domain-containing protein [Crassaminicella profunda]QZY56082.1 DUF4870 domain-containing protein [Crassaminicella profunda]